MQSEMDFVWLVWGKEKGTSDQGGLRVWSMGGLLRVGLYVGDVSWVDEKHRVMG